MTAPSDEYKQIGTRLDALRQRHAVLKAEEERRRVEREKLAEQLTSAGVDLGDLLGEKARLQGEVERLRAEAVRLVDEFEKNLDDAERGEPVAPGTPVRADREADQPPAGDEVEID